MSTAHSASFGDLLKRYRKAAGLTQEELAARARLSVDAISTLERGAHRKPRKDTLALLADAHNLSERERASLDAATMQRWPGAPFSNAGGAVFHQSERSLRLVGRSRELTLIERFLTGEGGPVLAMAGEPGIGKTRLLEETATRALAAGYSVLEGGCHRRSGQEPYAPLVGALARQLAQLPAAQQRLNLQGCGWLVRLLPELLESAVVPAPTWSVPLDQERRLMFAAVGRFLANVAGPAGTLLVLDDLQWAGADALDLMASLVRSEQAGALRVLCAYRSTEVRPPDPLGVMLADLARADLIAQMELAPLNREEAAVLLEEVLEGNGEEPPLQELAAHVRQLARRAGGVPYFLVSCAQGIRSGALESAPEDHVPWDVAWTIRQRVAVLSPTAQTLLEASAIIGRSASQSILAAVTSLPEHEMVAGLEAACEARLLEETEQQIYQFPHDLVREVIVAALSRFRRALLHRQVAQALEGQPVEHAAELADHYVESGDALRALPYALLAGDQAEAVFAHGEAEGYYRTAVELARSLGDTTSVGRALEKLGAVLHTTARYNEALAALEQAAELYDAGDDVEARGRVVAQIGWAYAESGASAAGVARLTGVLDAAPGLAPLGKARLHLALANLYMVEGRYDDALNACERAEALARVANDRGLLVRALSRRGTFLSERVGQVESGLIVAEEMIPLAEAAGDLWSLVGALNSIAEFYKYSGQNERARPYLARAVAAAEQSGDPSDLAFVLVTQGDNEWYAGDWKQARMHWERAEALLRHVTVSWRKAYPLLALGTVDLVEGQWEQADRRLQEAQAIAQGCGDIQAQRVIQWFLAERDLLQGQPEAARARLEPVINFSNKEHAMTEVLHLLAWAYLDLRDAARAEGVVSTGLARARPDKRWSYVVELLRVQAMIQLRQSHWSAAEAALEETLTLARDVSFYYPEAKALYTYGQLHTFRGEHQQARQKFEAALAILRRLGERMYAEHIERALATLESSAVTKGRGTRGAGG
jgi:tetratricopeptide (TPR) repeat protein/transcriptional regulator with XRE-family HTH domain